MSKYNLTDILKEYIGGGRIGTLNISYRDLADKMDQLERSGKAIVRERPGPSGDGKVNREFEVVTNRSAVPGGNKQERGFTVYDYKFGFDPASEEHFMEEYPFSVGGNDLDFAMELISDVKPYGLGLEESKTVDEGYIGDENYEDQKGSADQKLWVLSKLIDAGILKGYPSDEYKKALKAVDHVSAGEIKEENVIKDLAQADEVIKMIKMMNPDVRADLLMRIARMGQKMDENRREKNPEGMGQLYVQPAVQKAVKFHLDAYDKGDIDVDDMIQAIEDIIFGYVKAPGMSEQMYIDDDEFNKEMGRSKKDALKKEMAFHVDQLLDGNIDKNDFMNVVEDIMAELNLREEVEIPGSVLNKIAASVSNPSTGAKAMLDFYKQIQDKENIDLATNAKFKMAIDKLKDLADDKEVEEVMGIDRKGRKKPESKSNMTKVSEEEMISKAKYDKLLDNAANRYDELEMQFTKFIKDEYNKDFDIDDFRQFQVDNSIMEDEDMTKLKENFKRFL